MIFSFTKTNIYHPLNSEKATFLDQGYFSLFNFLTRSLPPAAFAKACGLTFFLSLFSCFTILAQTSSPTETDVLSLQIGFGENLKSEIIYIEEHTVWSITDSANNLISGVGFDLFNHTFSTPGVYSLKTSTKHKSHPGGCNHPDSNIAAQIEVSSVRVEWHFNSDFWYQLLVNQKNFNNKTVSLPVTIISYNNTSIETDLNLSVKIKGVQCNLIAISKFTASNLAVNSLNNINFILNGTIGNPSYVMVDFIDHNKNVQSFSVTKKLNN